MKISFKILALGTMLAVSSAAVSANEVYTYTVTDEEGEEIPVYGIMRRVSPNGKWAVGGDEDEYTGAYIVNTDFPGEAEFIPDGYLSDVNDNGLAVGRYYEYLGYYVAAYYSCGEWIKLPIPEDVGGRSEAIAISRDSKVICGHAMGRKIGDEPGRYYPIVWTLNEESGEYELTRYYNNLHVPGSYGFFVYDMTPNAKYICGIQCLDFSDTIAALLEVETGELKIWHNIEIKDWDFEGVGVYPTMFVDGIMDGVDELFGGRFNFATDRYLFGTHAIAGEPNEDGSGSIYNYAAVYDLATGEWVDSDETGTFVCGTSPDEVFNLRGQLIQDGHAVNFNNIINGDIPVACVYSFDDSGKVWTGSYTFVSPFGDLMESPVLIMLDEPGISGLQEALSDLSNGPLVTINDRTINVTGAKNVVIYSIEGSIITNNSHATVAPGIYIVVADKKTSKIIVR